MRELTMGKAFTELAKAEKSAAEIAYARLHGEMPKGFDLLEWWKSTGKDEWEKKLTAERIDYARAESGRRLIIKMPGGALLGDPRIPQVVMEIRGIAQLAWCGIQLRDMSPPKPKRRRASGKVDGLDGFAKKIVTKPERAIIKAGMVGT